MAANEAIDDNFLRIGDLITLQYVRFQSYLSCEGILDDSIYIDPSTGSFEDHLFMVCAQRQYSANMEYEEFLEKVSNVAVCLSFTLMYALFPLSLTTSSDFLKINPSSGSLEEQKYPQKRRNTLMRS